MMKSKNCRFIFFWVIVVILGIVAATPDPTKDQPNMTGEGAIPVPHLNATIPPATVQNSSSPNNSSPSIPMVRLPQTPSTSGLGRNIRFPNSTAHRINSTDKNSYCGQGFPNRLNDFPRPRTPRYRNRSYNLNNFSALSQENNEEPVLDCDRLLMRSPAYQDSPPNNTAFNQAPSSTISKSSQTEIPFHPSTSPPVPSPPYGSQFPVPPFPYLVNPNQSALLPRMPRRFVVTYDYFDPIVLWDPYEQRYVQSTPPHIIIHYPTCMPIELLQSASYVQCPSVCTVNSRPLSEEQANATYETQATSAVVTGTVGETTYYTTYQSVSRNVTAMDPSFSPNSLPRTEENASTTIGFFPSDKDNDLDDQNYRRRFN